jgi:hypothetical protein
MGKQHQLLTKRQGSVHDLVRYHFLGSSLNLISLSLSLSLSLSHSFSLSLSIGKQKREGDVKKDHQPRNLSHVSLTQFSNSRNSIVRFFPSGEKQLCRCVFASNSGSVKGDTHINHATGPTIVAQQGLNQLFSLENVSFPTI